MKEKDLNYWRIRKHELELFLDDAEHEVCRLQKQIKKCDEMIGKFLYIISLSKSPGEVVK